MNIQFNPWQQTNAPGSFVTTTSGLIVGTAYPDPSTRFALAGGYLSATAPNPVWGGCALSLNIPGPFPSGLPTYPNQALQSSAQLATQLAVGGGAGINAFCTFDQALAGVITPNSPVPQYGPGSSINFYRLGSKARLALTINPVLVSAEGGDIQAPFSWDFVNQQLGPYQAAYVSQALAASPGGATWATGGVFAFTTAAANTVVPGAAFTITGVTPTAYNGTYVAGTVVGNVITAVANGAANPGASSGAAGTLAAGGGALNVSVLDIDIGNSMVPVYNAATGALTWNRSGSAAVVLL